MKLDLTKPFTKTDVQNLIASKDDSENRQLRVTKAGIAFLSDEVGNENIQGLLFRLETCSAGCGYTGIEAAQDAAYVARIEKVLRDNWPKPSSSYIDDF